jgi:hypothetical protein
LAKLALGRSHQANALREISHLLLQNLRIRFVREVVAHGDATSSLFERELALVCQNPGELLLVIGASLALPQALDEDDAERVGLLSRERSERVGQLIVRGIEPAPLGRIMCGVECGEFLKKQGHARSSRLRVGIPWGWKGSK